MALGALVGALALLALGRPLARPAQTITDHLTETQGPLSRLEWPRQRGGRTASFPARLEYRPPFDLRRIGGDLHGSLARGWPWWARPDSPTGRAPTLSELAMIDETIVYTCDEKIPLSDADRGMANGWRMIPVPPTDDCDWIAVDNRSDRKTGWLRRSQMDAAGLSRH
jgi:hypothetical protein